MPPIIGEIFGFLGFLLSALGLFVFGFAGGRFVQDAFQKSAWQVQAALALVLFGSVVGIAKYATPGSAGAFALGVGLAFLSSSINLKKKEEDQKS